MKRAAATCPAVPSAQVRVLSPDGRLAALAEGNKVRVFDTSTGNERPRSIPPMIQFRRLIFSADSARLVIVDDKIRWLSAASGEVIAAVESEIRPADADSSGSVGRWSDAGRRRPRPP